MPRGRRSVPDEIQALKGNPRKRRLKPRAEPARAAQEVLPPARVEFQYPDFLTQKNEREIFRLVVEEFLPRNLVRETDFNALGRYACFMALWIEAKQQYESAGRVNWYKSKSKHGEMLRRHPSLTDMLDIDHSLRQMEPQLALTPMARNTIMARFIAAANPGGLFGGGEAPKDPEPQAPDAPGDGPLGLLARVAASSSGDKLN